jgi:cell pole-organizing protein PopZ
MPAPRAPEPKSVAPTKPAPEPVSNSQDDIDAMLAGLDFETPGVADQSALDDDVLELTEQMTVAEPRKAFQTVEPNNDIEFSEPVPAPVTVAPVTSKSLEDHVRAKVIEEVAAPTARPLMSNTTMASVDSAFNALAQTVLSNNARTLEDLVKEMLRPMLKGWLDDNLPGLVEKIVRAEIERVSRGR